MARKYVEQTAEDRHEELMERLDTIGSELGRVAEATERIAEVLEERLVRKAVRNG